MWGVNHPTLLETQNFMTPCYFGAPEKAAVFCGSFLGLITSNLFAVTLGRHLLAHVREKTLHLLSAFLFFGFGSWMLFQLYVPTQTQVVIYCLLLFTLAYLYALWQKRRTRS